MSSAQAPPSGDMDMDDQSPHKEQVVRGSAWDRALELVAGAGQRLRQIWQRRPAAPAAQSTPKKVMEERESKPAPRSSAKDPRILTRAEHSISRKRISNAALRVLYGLRDAGYQGYLVGGAVRDLLLGAEPKDFDVATDARPEDIQRVFRSCRLIGRRFRIAHVRFGGEIIEVTTFRGSGAGEAEDGDREVADGLILRDNVWGTLEEDAARRDFTVNALYYNIDDFSVRDEVGGLADLEARQLRLIGDPVQRFREDPVRMLRAARLAAKLGFELHPATRAPIGEMAGLLDAIPPARLFDDLQKLFMYGHAERSLRWLLDLKLFEHLFPGVDTRPDSGDLPLIRAALVNTDQRIAQGKSVTPAFLFAALLWPSFRRELEAIAGDDEATPEQLHEAADRVFDEHTGRVALPRRFSAVTREIWLLQDRFATHTPARARRLIRHPKFRAGYDFFVLRAEADPALADLAARWTQAQQVEGADFDRLFKLPPAGAAKPAGAKRKRRRRRTAKPGPAPDAG